jgi:hypothetical protein
VVWVSTGAIIIQQTPASSGLDILFFIRIIPPIETTAHQTQINDISIANNMELG